MTGSTDNKLGVLVTRPAHQAEGFCQLLENAGFDAVRFPVLEIVDSEDNPQLQQLIDHLDEFHIAIFISPNAVHRAINRIRASRPWPSHLQVAAVGRSSAKSLDKMGLATDIFPRQKFNSEALLELPELQSEQIADKKVIIFRGEGGREHLAEELKRRGALVSYAEVYKRIKPKADVGQLLKLWARGKIKLVTTTSNESLQNLFDMLGQLGRQWLIKTPLLVTSERALELAKSLGFKHTPIVAEQTSDEAMLQAILDWQQQQKGRT